MTQYKFDEFLPKPRERDNKIEVPDSLDETGTNFKKPQISLNLSDQINRAISWIGDIIVNKVKPIVLDSVTAFAKGAPAYLWISIIAIVAIAVFLLVS